jgi:hypothetical protein
VSVSLHIRLHYGPRDKPTLFLFLCRQVARLETLEGA